MARSKHTNDILDPVLANLGRTIKQARLNIGYTREQLSEYSGIGVRYITAIENENKIPRLQVLSKLIRALNISANTIFYPETNNNNPEIEMITKLLLACNEQDYKVLKAVIEAMIKNNKEK